MMLFIHTLLNLQCVLSSVRPHRKRICEGAYMKHTLHNVGRISHHANLILMNPSWVIKRILLAPSQKALPALTFVLVVTFASGTPSVLLIAVHIRIALQIHLLLNKVM